MGSTPKKNTAGGQLLVSGLKKVSKREPNTMGTGTNVKKVLPKSKLGAK